MAHALATPPNPWMVLPFPALLAAIALGPLLFPNWWLKHYAKTAGALALVTVAYYLIGLHDALRVLEVAREYISFIVLIGSLYVVAGGIHIRVKGEATPLANVAYLFIGAVVANILGTTGASMLLIRPWIRMNQYRVTAHHIVFFIFIVANIGGCLTPVGDPPLFLGYLQGVPFWWVARHCWPAWTLGMGVLLAIFYVLDRRNFLLAPPPVREQETAGEQWRFQGLWNLVFLAAILGAVFVSHPVFLRELIMIGAAAGSYLATRKETHAANHFTLHPIREVAVLFAGIFGTMIPALDLLQAHAGVARDLGPGFFFWGSGALSSGLDNAPTYLSFFSVIFGQTASVADALANAVVQHKLLAISIGSVFFGASTYIGNGPNFMVKAIADHRKVRTPTFGGYVFKYTLPCLGPLLVLVWWLFFRP